MNKKTERTALEKHLLRHSFADIVAALSHRLGLEHISLAEDSAQEALLKATKIWPFSGVPRNPSGWLYRVALNKALDVLRSASSKKNQPIADTQNLADLAVEPTGETLDGPLNDEDLSMMFAMCHPLLSERMRLSMTLRFVSGLSAGEIASLLLVTPAAVSQQIVRGKRLLRERDISLSVPEGRSIQQRTGSVLATLYLLFTAGYAFPGGDTALREDMCLESLRLAELLWQTEAFRTPELAALIALFAAQLSRFPARIDSEGLPVPLAEQDRSLWDERLRQTAFEYLQKAGTGDQLSRYHLEAGIAAEHLAARSLETTNWALILTYYDLLLKRAENPVVLLNRLVAVSYASGPREALAELERHDSKDLSGLYQYHLLKADLYRRLNRSGDARASYEQAKKGSSNAALWQWLDRQKTRLSQA